MGRIPNYSVLEVLVCRIPSSIRQPRGRRDRQMCLRPNMVVRAWDDATAPAKELVPVFHTTSQSIPKIVREVTELDLAASHLPQYNP